MGETVLEKTILTLFLIGPLFLLVTIPLAYFMPVIACVTLVVGLALILLNLALVIVDIWRNW